MSAKADCHAHRPIVVTDSNGYLASLTAAETGCGTSDAPWLIEAMPGQRINVTLFDFSPPDVALHGQVLHRSIQTLRHVIEAAECVLTPDFPNSKR